MLQKTPPADAATPKKSWVPSRRAFLIGTGATLGVLVGFAVWPRNYPNTWPVGGDERLMNAFVKIGTDGVVTVAVPQAEMGQGSYSGLAQVIADELGADWRTVAVEPAPLHPAYAQTGLVTTATRDMAPPLRAIVNAAGSTLIRRLDMQLTGGSSSIKNYHDIYRTAGASARTMLCAAAAREWDIDAADCDTANGFVIYKANRMSFAEAAKKADPKDASESPVLRAEEQRPLVGKPVLRLDLPGKVDGSARFGGDVRLPGMVFAAIRHGPVGGSLRSCAPVPGVTMVKGANWVAAVGETNWAAKTALAKLAPDFAIAGRPAGPWIEAALTAALSASDGEAVGADDTLGDMAGKTPVSADYSVPFLAHACMEPMVATARVTDGRVELWAPVQSLTLCSWGVARALDIDSRDVTVHPTLLGGGFGRKAETDALEQAALIARAVGKPVQLQWDRTEDLGSDMYRPAAAARMKGAVADRRIAAWDARIAVPSVQKSFMARNMPMLASDTDKPNAQAIEGAEENVYGIPAFRAVHAPVDQPVPLGFWRSVGHSFSAFFVESFVDELAVAAGVDPFTFRMSHLKDKPRHAGVLKLAAEKGEFLGAAPAGFGRGIAIHESFGSIVAMVIEAGVKDKGVVVSRVTSVIDCGRAVNPDSVKAQLEGGAIYGLAAALYEAVTFEKGRATATNFDGYPLLPLAESPDFSTHILNQGGPLGGVGEPGTPPVAPALANALAAATGRRARALPLAPFYSA
ncbi:xanthine dehydrogenase family protein molybdopterin-binding subunit [Sandaracinobacteroides saxicola]|uniref:Xanthine dehydrogenase family protein molybdopterin-binding subunit n=1 Tax=Sandaracinobacteroides saxicola TaxID=2759707 RepID=A0A7G5IGJ4_9SPHN|nr:molybdopterin cofactor-binding domain-containing protein [Sandaracinobacteroides saxicola]QMW22486.1 xanthine dehydrogenase family protein molybdopterin-binding subunit [Sandaracinobacteroides saxicola]